MVVRLNHFPRDQKDVPRGVTPRRSKSKIIAIAMLSVIVGALIIISNGMPTGILAPTNTTSTSTSTVNNPIAIITSTTTQTPIKNVTSPFWMDELLANLTQTTTTQTTTTQTSTTTSNTGESTTTKSTTSSTTTKPYESKPTVNITELEIEVHNLINLERQSRGLRALSLDTKLSDIARDHSKDMAQNNFFDHDNLKGQDPTAIAKAQGYNTYKNFGAYYRDGIGENILQNNLYDSVTYINGIPTYDWNTQSEIAQSSVQLWMNSPGHRQNILDPDYDKEGIGIAISSDGKVYITQDLW